ncbi:hypothetical protein MKX03_011514 [Papaver bracteatum]|nr:hypothetical protein MKX03_011514 [Papaver bracteatum]
MCKTHLLEKLIKRIHHVINICTAVGRLIVSDADYLEGSSYEFQICTIEMP